MRYTYTTEAEQAVFFLIVVPIAIGAFCGWLASILLGDKTNNSVRITAREHNTFWVVMAVVSIVLIFPAFHAVCSPPETDENTAPGTFLTRAIGAVLIFILARAALFVWRRTDSDSQDLAVSVFARALMGAFFLVFGAILLVFADHTAAYIGESCNFLTYRQDSPGNMKAGFFGIVATGAAFLLTAVISKPADKLLKTAEMAILFGVFIGSFLLARIYFTVAHWLA